MVVHADRDHDPFEPRSMNECPICVGPAYRFSIHHSTLSLGRFAGQLGRHALGTAPEAAALTSIWVQRARSDPGATGRC
jgi:hypothetical protein